MNVKLKHTDEVFIAEQVSEPTEHGGITVPVGYWKLTTITGNPVSFAPSNEYFKKHYSTIKKNVKEESAKEEIPSQEG